MQWLAQSMERQSAERDVAGSNPDWRANTQGLKITGNEDAAFAMTSPNG